MHGPLEVPMVRRVCRETRVRCQWCVRPAGWSRSEAHPAELVGHRPDGKFVFVLGALALLRWLRPIGIVVVVIAVIRATSAPGPGGASVWFVCAVGMMTADTARSAR